MFLDLMTTKFWLDYSTKPMHFFGFFGLTASGAGILTGSLLLLQKLIAREAFASNTTMAISTITLLLAGAQIICLGLVSEMLSRTYYESQKKSIYVTRQTAISSNELDYEHDPARIRNEDGETHAVNRTPPFQRPAQPRPESPMLRVSADQPLMVRKVPRNRLA